MSSSAKCFVCGCCLPVRSGRIVRHLDRMEECPGSNAPVWQAHNRLSRFLPLPPPDPPPLDKLLDKAFTIELRLHRLDDGDGILNTFISFEVHGDVSADDHTLAALLAQFARPRQEGGAV